MSYLDKLAKVEALLQRAWSEGERQAAELAKGRIITKISDLQVNCPIEYKISLDSPWKRRLLATLCASMAIEPIDMPAKDVLQSMSGSLKM